MYAVSVGPLVPVGVVVVDSERGAAAGGGNGKARDNARFTRGIFSKEIISRMPFPFA